MQVRFGRLRLSVCLMAIAAAVAFCASGCISGGSLALLGSPLFSTVTGTTPPPGTGTTGTGSGFFSSGGRAEVDPCSETNARKFVRISMRNISTETYIHYFFVAVAFVNGDIYPNGAVCPDDIGLYTSFGYTEIPEGVSFEFGTYCFDGPALFYFHENGQFRAGGGVGGSQLASAIAPAQGTNPTFDNFFVAGGAQIPVPNMIIFHNPGTGEGQALKISRNDLNPCGIVIGSAGVSDCNQDAFYYVDEFDLMAGSNALGTSSGRRVPSEIQGTGCQCSAISAFNGRNYQPAQVLAPSGATASGALCNEFFRGGSIEYAFVREDTNPPFPQLLWRVTDQSGAEAHDFDTRADIP